VAEGSLTSRPPEKLSEDGDLSDPINEEPIRPQTPFDWVVWVALWPIVAIAWVVVLPFALIVGGIGWFMGYLTSLMVRDAAD
jgi:hypothetical protein